MATSGALLRYTSSNTTRQRAAISGGSPVLELTDNHGGQFLVPTSAVGYVQIGAEETRRVGFVA